MSGNPGRSRLGQVARLSRESEAAAAAGRFAEAVALLKEAVRLDPRDRRALHRLGDLHRIRLNRFREAAACYAREARCEEAEGFHARAIALWRLALRCDPARLEGYERIGALYVELGRTADARQHYERSAAELREAGLVPEAAIVRAHLAALSPPAIAVVDPPVPAAPPRAAPLPPRPRPRRPRPTTTPPTSRPITCRTGASSTTTACTRSPASSSSCSSPACPSTSRPGSSWWRCAARSRTTTRPRCTCVS